MKIIENFLPPSLFENIKPELLGSNFPWYFNDSITYNKPTGNDFQFTHIFYRDQKQQSNFYSLVHSFLYVAELKLKENIKGIVRIKANLNSQNSLINPVDNIHQDMTADGNFMSLLYYVMDSDGDTLFFDDDKKTVVDRITPQENKAVWFDSKMWHASSPPIENKRRVVINFILEVE
jgi:hypothetical protein